MNKYIFRNTTYGLLGQKWKIDMDNLGYWFHNITENEKHGN